MNASSDNNLPWLTINHQSNIPPYEQIRRGIIEAVTERRMIVGERLPPVRELAKHLNLSANTVARAYRELEQAGIVHTHGRAGTIVAADSRLEKVAEAAAAYLMVAQQQGLSYKEAVDIVLAALNRISPGK